jgi:hypothetical protein
MSGSPRRSGAKPSATMLIPAGWRDGISRPACSFIWPPSCARDRSDTWEVNCKSARRSFGGARNGFRRRWWYRANRRIAGLFGRWRGLGGIAWLLDEIYGIAISFRGPHPLTFLISSWPLVYRNESWAMDQQAEAKVEQRTQDWPLNTIPLRSTWY